MMALPRSLAQLTQPISKPLWLPWLGLASLILLWLYSFAATWLAMVKIWYHIETFAHCFFIIPISLYLIWQRRQALSVAPIGFSWWPVWLHLGLLMGWLFGQRSGIQVIEQFAVLAMLPNFVWLLWGTQKCRLILFPLLYSLFALPFGEFLIPSLQQITADMAVWLLRLSSVPVYQEGMFLYIPDARFEVAWTCSGIRYLLAALSLGCLFAYLHFRSYSKRMLFILFSIVLPILANGIRAWSIIMIYYFIDQSIAGDLDHLIYGWVFFALVIGILFLFGWWFSEPNQATSSESPLAEFKVQHTHIVGYFSLSIASLLILSSFALSLVLSGRSQSSPEPLMAKPLPAAAMGWQGPAMADELYWQPSFVNADQYWHAQYSQAGQVVTVYSAFYFQERQGKELVSVLNHIYDPHLWFAQSHSTYDWQIGDVSMASNQIDLSNELGEQISIYFWYQVGEQSSLGGITTKLQQWLNAPFGPASGSVYAIMVPTQGGQQLVQAFLIDHLASIQLWLGQPVISAKEAENGLQ